MQDIYSHQLVRASFWRETTKSPSSFKKILYCRTSEPHFYLLVRIIISGVSGGINYLLLASELSCLFQSC